MRLLHVDTLDIEDFPDSGNQPEYAILSHTWGEEEVTFKDITTDQEAAQQKKGFAKINGTCKQARANGFDYVWVDTCCIDKTSSAELSEAINSMFSWYANAGDCYVYLQDFLISSSDGKAGDVTPDRGENSESSTPLLEHHQGLVPGKNNTSQVGIVSDDHTILRVHPVSREDPIPNQDTASPKHAKSGSEVVSDMSRQHLSTEQEKPAGLVPDFARSRWFTRGWTLQELIAPNEVIFYDRDWQRLGSLDELVEPVSQATGVPAEILWKVVPLKTVSIAKRMSWASRRSTTRIEDEAYCLLGIFDINMPLLWRRQEGFRPAAKGDYRNLYRPINPSFRLPQVSNYVWPLSEIEGTWTLP